MKDKGIEHGEQECLAKPFYVCTSECSLYGEEDAQVYCGICEEKGFNRQAQHLPLSHPSYGNDLRNPRKKRRKQTGIFRRKGMQKRVVARARWRKAIHTTGLESNSEKNSAVSL